uniref:Bifunctional inhibitor/plant lipid transfer protein/seed storage helical domain-containing protein n=1 Tax=Oryza meridionalis TaxID=40149 RepID=A0A0E0E5E4_9ORYZ
MAPSSKLAALFFAFAVVAAATLAPAAEARVQGFNHEAASEPAIAAAGESKAATGGGAPTLPGLPGLPFPLFPFLTLPFPLIPIGGSSGGAPPSAGSGFRFPFPLPLPFPAPASPGGAPPSSGSGFPAFPLPFPLPHPSSPGASPSSGFQFPFPFPFPSSPVSPPSQPSPASPAAPAPPSPPQPKECLTPLLSMMSCADYLTNSSAQTPPGTCCEGFKSLVSTAPICLCHGINGDLSNSAQTPPGTCCEGFKSLVSTAPICLCHGINGDLSKFLPLPVDMMKMMTLPNTCGATVPLQTFSMCNTPSVPPLMPSAAPAPASPPSS